MEVSPSLIVGVEGDLGYDFSRVSATGAKFGTTWSARARAGYAMDNVLLYAAAGYAGTRIQVTNSGVTSKGTLNGWTVGAGVDAKLTDNIFARAEYRFNQMDGSVTVSGVATSNRARQHVFNFGIGYKF